MIGNIGNDKMKYSYKLKDTSVKNKTKLLRECCAISFNWHIDSLDCSLSFTRQKTDLSLDDVLEMFDNSCHFVIIKRLRGDRLIADSEPYYEVGFSTMNCTKPDYYLFIYVSVQEFEKITKGLFAED
jgi:hypothetical protein